MQRALLSSLREHLPGALSLLEARGYAPARLAFVAQALAAPGHVDVALAYRHGFLDARGAEVPLPLVWLGCLLGEGSDEAWRRLMALRGRLVLEARFPQLAAAALLLSRWGPEAGLSWLEVAARLEPEGQEELLTALVNPAVPRSEAGTYDVQVEPFVSRRPERRLYYLQGLAAGLSSDYLVSGFRLLDAHGVEGTLPLPSTSGPVPEQCLLTLFDHVRPETTGSYSLATLWGLCGELPGFAPLLASIPWTTLPPAAAYALVELLTSLWWEPGVERQLRLQRWSAARRLFPSVLQSLGRVPSSHQQRCVRMISHCVAFIDRPWEAPAHHVSTVLALVERLCRPPFDAVDRISWALEALLAHPEPEVRERLLRASDRSFLLWEESCSSGSVAGLVGEGMVRLVAHDPGWVLDAFERFAETLARVARWLGTLRRHVALGLMAEFARHPLVREDPFRLPPQQLASLLREHCTAGVDSPLPRKARLALESGQALPEGQWARALSVASARLPLLRLQVLARAVLAQLRGSLPADVEDARVRHALQMASLIEDNRRALRRLLARYFAGERDFITRHPVSRAWFERHPRLNRQRWLEGLALRREVPGVGEVALAVEQDALEALRLGTYAGSCLGLNGACDYSAAAVVLDVNKRVLYARDARGHVLARQLLAVSDDDTLVPFAVYPESTPPALQALFLDYDMALAESLGLPLSDGPTYPEVENLLSTSFWHDGAWDLGAPEGSR
jgi:hypothetical protein